MSRKVLGILALVLAGTFLNAASVLAVTVVVANGAYCSANGLPPAAPQYTTIQAALNALPDATYATNTIVVCPGTYPEQLTITKNVTIRGAKLDGTDPVGTFGNSNVAMIVVPPGGLVTPAAWGGSVNVAAQVSAQNVTDVYLSNLTIDGTGIGCPVGANGSPVRTAGVAFYNVGIAPGNDSKGNVNHVALQNQAGSCVDPSAGFHVPTADGIIADSSAIRIDSNSITHIDRNPIEQIGGISVITGNYMNWCLNGGLLLTNVAPIGANSSTVTANKITVLYNAIYLSQGSGIRVTGNTLLSWTGDGIKLNGSTDNWIVSNTIADSAHAIYLLNGAARNYVSGNTIVRPGEVGIVDWYPAGGNQITGNTISQANIGVFQCNAAGDIINPNVFFNVAALNVTGCNFVP